MFSPCFLPLFRLSSPLFCSLSFPLLLPPFSLSSFPSLLRFAKHPYITAGTEHHYLNPLELNDQMEWNYAGKIRTGSFLGTGGFGGQWFWGQWFFGTDLGPVVLGIVVLGTVVFGTDLGPVVLGTVVFETAAREFF